MGKPYPYCSIGTGMAFWARLGLHDAKDHLILENSRRPGVFKRACNSTVWTGGIYCEPGGDACVNCTGLARKMRLPPPKGMS